MATITDCCKDVLNKASLEELEQIYFVLLEGKSYFEKYEEVRTILKSVVPEADLETKTATAVLDTFRQKHKSKPKPELETEIPRLMNEAIEKRFGIFDDIRGITDDYGAQLELCIEAVRRGAKNRNIEIKEPSYKHPVNTVEGALEREEILVSLLFDFYLQTMTPEERESLMKQVTEQLQQISSKFGSHLDALRIGAAVLVGGVTALRTALGFQFHVLLAVVANALARSLGISLSVAMNAALQRAAGMLLGPVGWVITTALALPTIAEILNPRDYQRYISAVLYIYALRHKRSLIASFEA